MLLVLGRTSLWTRAKLDPSLQKVECDLDVLHMLKPPPFSRQELSDEQQADSTSKELFEQVRPSNEAKSAAF